MGIWKPNLLGSQVKKNSWILVSPICLEPGGIWEDVKYLQEPAYDRHAYISSKRRWYGRENSDIELQFFSKLEDLWTMENPKKWRENPPFFSAWIFPAH